MANQSADLQSPRGERRCTVGVDHNGQNIVEPFVRKAWAEDLLLEIWEQACQGVFTNHGECPATYACSAILAALVSAGYCANCFGHDDKCREANKQHKKCCPDCTHDR